MCIDRGYGGDAAEAGGNHTVDIPGLKKGRPPLAGRWPVVEPEIRTKHGKNYNGNALERERERERVRERDGELLCVFGPTLAVRNPRSRLNALRFNQNKMSAALPPLARAIETG